MKHVHATTTNSLPRFLFEDCLSLLRGLVVLAWVGVAAGATAEIWIRYFSDHDWPQLGGFSFTYNAVLLEFALNTAVLTLLLIQGDWYERVPRESSNRLRWLLVAVLVWEGLHLFGAFHVTGSLQGPLLPLLPLLLAGALVVLPGRSGWWLAGYLLTGHLMVLLLESTGKIHKTGLLSDVFSLNASVSSLGLLALACIVATALALGVVARRWIYPDMGLLSPSQRLDHATGLFRRAFLDQRLEAELGRTRRQGGHLALLLLAPERRGRAALAEADLRKLALRLLGMLRLESDTPARFGPGVFAILLPAADAAGLGHFVQRLTQELSEEGQMIPLRAAAVVTNGNAVDGPGLIRTIEEALWKASVGEAVSIIRMGEGT
jgi:GGDEF domain-containing protein